MNRKNIEALPLLTIESPTGEVSLLEATDVETEATSTRRLLSVPGFHPPHVSQSQLSLSSLPTVVKESVEVYHSRPLSAPSSVTSLARDSSLDRDTDIDDLPRSSQVETQGQKVRFRATSRVADQVKDILTGRKSGKVTAKILDKVQPKAEAAAAAAQQKAVSGGQDTGVVGKALPAASDKATLSNPLIPSIDPTEEGSIERPRTEFAQPFYSTLGRYKPHDPEDEAFVPMTLAMSYEQDEAILPSRVSMKRATLMMRRSPSSSQTSLVIPQATAEVGTGGGGRGSGGTGSPKLGVRRGGGAEDSNKTKMSLELDAEMEEEPRESQAMMQSIVSIMKFMAQSNALAKEVEAVVSNSSGVEGRLSSAAAVAAAKEDARDEMAVPTITTPDGGGGGSMEPAVASVVVEKAEDAAPAEKMNRDEMEALRLSVRAMVGLQRWKKKAHQRIRQARGPHVTVKSFAKNAKHGALLQKNLETLAVELPLPVRKMLHDEALPIMADVLHAYERTLGKANPLTEQAKARLENMTKFIKTYDEM